MHRPRSIVGLGWLALDETPEGTAPSGVAALAVLAAVRSGHRARVIGRVGQDAAADELARELREAGVDVSAVQLDPDLPTAERRVRADGTASSRIDELEAAPDRLQWDYDLEDAARWADVVVFGLESWRSGQARSEELRFLDEAAAAVRAVDLTALVPSGRRDADVPRQMLETALDHATIALVDGSSLVALRALPPGPAELPAMLDAAAALARRHEAILLLATGQDEQPTFVLGGTDGDPSPRRIGGGPAKSDVGPRPGLDALVHAAVVALLDPAGAAIAEAVEATRTPDVADHDAPRDTTDAPAAADAPGASDGAGAS